LGLKKISEKVQNIFAGKQKGFIFVVPKRKWVLRAGEPGRK
jgi:hypothetical protein